MARKKIREYDSKRLLKEHLKRLCGIDLKICSAQVLSLFIDLLLVNCNGNFGYELFFWIFANGVLIYVSFSYLGTCFFDQFNSNLLCIFLVAIFVAVKVEFIASSL